MELRLRRKEEAPHASPRTASQNDPQECGALRQGNIALIHSAPTGEKIPSWGGGALAPSRTMRLLSFEMRAKSALLRMRRRAGIRNQCPLWAFFIAASCSG